MLITEEYNIFWGGNNSKLINTELLFDEYVNDTFPRKLEIQLLTRDLSINEVCDPINWKPVEGAI